MKESTNSSLEGNEGKCIAMDVIILMMMDDGEIIQTIN